MQELPRFELIIPQIDNEIYSIYLEVQNYIRKNKSTNTLRNFMKNEFKYDVFLREVDEEYNNKIEEILYYCNIKRLEYNFNGNARMRIYMYDIIMHIYLCKIVFENIQEEDDDDVKLARLTHTTYRQFPMRCVYFDFEGKHLVLPEYNDYDEKKKEVILDIYNIINSCAVLK
jgi:hypothetical protein